MTPPRSSTRIGLFALLLGLIIVSLIGSLVAADRALATADRRAVALDARVAASLAERELLRRAGQLGELLSLRLPGVDLTADPLPSQLLRDRFEAIAVTDTAGRVVFRAGTGEQAQEPDSATAVTSRIALDAHRSGGPVVRAIPAAAGVPGGVRVAVPLTHRGEDLGAAVGVLRTPVLLDVVRDDSARRPRLSLRAAGQSLGSIGDTVPRYGLIAADAPLGLPGDRLLVQVSHAQSGRLVRTALWMLGAVGLAALLVGLARERRQAINLAARTAELERLYQEVARSNRMKSEFLANVSHELRTPLNAIVGFVEMLREGVYGELTPRQALPVDRIAASATHLRQLVDRLLDIAKIAAGRVEMHMESTVLRPFVLNVASEMESLIAERGLSLSVGVSPSLPRLRTDQTQLRQILINMIGNAVKYTPSGGIQVRARLAGSGADPVIRLNGDLDGGQPPDPSRRWVALQVSDTGIGIASADLERIFDEFEQVNAGARSDSVNRGTGLGLAISRRLARLLGGDLTVASEPGRGSTFTLWLPLDSESSLES